MADPEENVSPEEKLLNVIQSDGEEQPAPEEKLAEAAAAEPVAAEPATAPEKPAAEKPAAAKTKPKLAAKKDAPREAAPKADEQAAQEAPKEAAAEPAAPADDAGSLPFSKKKSGGASGIKVINRMLAAGIVIMVGLSSFEVFRVIRARGAIKNPGTITIPPDKEFAISLAEVQKGYSLNDPWWQPSDATGGTGGDGTQKRFVEVSITPWQQEIKNYTLVAVQLREPKENSDAILMDTSDSKLYFVRLGKTLTIDGRDITLNDIEAQSVRFTDGRNSVELK